MKFQRKYVLVSQISYVFFYIYRIMLEVVLYEKKKNKKNVEWQLMAAIKHNNVSSSAICRLSNLENCVHHQIN